MNKEEVNRQIEELRKQAFEIKGIGSYKFNFEGKSFDKGLYKLVKVD